VRESSKYFGPVIGFMIKTNNYNILSSDIRKIYNISNINLLCLITINKISDYNIYYYIYEDIRRLISNEYPRNSQINIKLYQVFFNYLNEYEREYNFNNEIIEYIKDVDKEIKIQEIMNFIILIEMN